MAADDESSLESILNKATNPARRDEDWEAIMSFCDRVNKELEGPQISVRLLAHKIQSPQEREALFALATLEACVKNCGKRFHQEIGKFRFLNEIIKVVSPKYLGAHTTEKVKKKCIEILYSWTLGLKHETKILEAYSMLKRQAIVKEDPVHVEKTYEPPPTDRDRKATFEDEEKSKLLARLLKSKNPEDLQAANRLIKNMVRQDAERLDKVSRRVTELETVSNNIKLLAEMLQHYTPGVSTDADTDLMKELYENLEKERPKLFRLASDTDEKDAEGINEILRVNDSVLKIMIEYKKIVEGISEENGIGTLTSSPSKGNTSALLDLELGLSSSTITQAKSPPVSGATANSIVDDQLLSLGLGATANGETTTTTGSGSTGGSDSDALGDLFGATPASTANAQKQDLLESLLGGAPTATTAPSGFSVAPGGSIPPALALPPPGRVFPGVTTSAAPGLAPLLSSPPAPASSVVTGILPSAGQAAPQSLTPSHVQPVAAPAQPPVSQAQKSALDDLDKLGQSLLQQSLPLEQASQASFPVPPDKVPLNQISAATTTAAAPGPTMGGAGTSTVAAQPLIPATSTSPKRTGKLGDVQPLTDVFVPLESIKPGSVQPLNIYDRNGMKVVLHFGKDSPRDDVLVMVVSIMSVNETPVTKCTFQAAVPKMMKVKLQPPSATDLPAYNPILPPTAVTQVLLIANPHKEKIRLKFKLTYNTNEGPQSDVGEEDNFPVPL